VHGGASVSAPTSPTSFAERYGPWAVVAGASEGVGRELARLVAARGVPCVLLARREGPLRALAEEIRRESGVDCVAASVDLAAPDALDCAGSPMRSTAITAGRSSSES
jgi:short-subunit dehydrogenase